MRRLSFQRRSQPYIQLISATDHCLILYNDLSLTCRIIKLVRNLPVSIQNILQPMILAKYFPIYFLCYCEFPHPFSSSDANDVFSLFLLSFPMRVHSALLPDANVLHLFLFFSRSSSRRAKQTLVSVCLLLNGAPPFLLRFQENR